MISVMHTTYKQNIKKCPVPLMCTVSLIYLEDDDDVSVLCAVFFFDSLGVRLSLLNLCKRIFYEKEG